MTQADTGAVKAQSPADAVYLKITDLEYDLVALKDGMTAMTVLVEHIRATPAGDGRHDALDLQDASIWMGQRLEQLAIGIHAKWEAANELAYDMAYPKVAAQRARSAAQS